MWLCCACNSVCILTAVLRRASDVFVPTASGLQHLTTIDMAENPFTHVPDLTTMCAALQAHIPTLVHVHVGTISCHPSYLERLGTQGSRWDVHMLPIDATRTTHRAWLGPPTHGLNHPGPPAQQDHLKRAPLVASDTQSPSAPIVTLSVVPSVTRRFPPTETRSPAQHPNVTAQHNNSNASFRADYDRIGIRRLVGSEGVLSSSLSHVCLQDCLLESSTVSALQHCHGLVDLCVSGNCLTDLSFLPEAPGLWRLDVDGNALEHLEGIQRVQGSLTCLSVSHNGLRELSGVGHLPRLEVLLAYDNTMAHLRHTFPLRPLKSLCVLGLAGNPLDQCDEYRLFLIDTLRFLVDLDGIQITARDDKAAKMEFHEQLNAEKMYDLMGGTDDAARVAQVLDFADGGTAFCATLARKMCCLCHQSCVACVSESVLSGYVFCVTNHVLSVSMIMCCLCP